MLGSWMDCWGSVASNGQWDLLWTRIVCRLAKHDWKGEEDMGIYDLLRCIPCFVHHSSTIPFLIFPM